MCQPKRACSHRSSSLQLSSAWDYDPLLGCDEDKPQDRFKDDVPDFLAGSVGELLADTKLWLAGALHAEPRRSDGAPASREEDKKELAGRGSPWIPEGCGGLVIGSECSRRRHPAADLAPLARSPADLPGLRFAFRGPEEAPARGGAGNADNTVGEATMSALRGRQSQTTVKATTTIAFELPLHVKNVPRLCWDRLRSIMAPDENEFDTLRQMVTDPVGYTLAHGMMQIPCGLVTEALLSAHDMSSLLHHGYIRPLAESELILGTVRVFSVIEKQATRRRVIFCPDEWNDVLDMVPTMVLPRIGHWDYDPLVQDNGAITGDFPAFYSQFPLTFDQGRQFVFSFGGQMFALCTIATGQRQCPALAQLVATAIVRHARMSVPGGSMVRCAAYIDNVKLSGPQPVVTAVWDAVVDTAQNVGSQIEREITWSRRHVFLGVDFDCFMQRLSLGPKLLEKLVALDMSFGTYRSFLRAFGILNFCNQIIRRKSGGSSKGLYYVLKFLRRRHAAPLDAPASVWPSVVKHMQQWKEQLLALPYADIVSSHSADHHLEVYSDSSIPGWGVTIFDGATTWLESGTWADAENIQILEARAFLRSVLAVLQYIEDNSIQGNTRIDFFIDNTSVLGGFGKNRHRNFAIDGIIAQVNDLLARAGITEWTLSYVSSAFNYADYPSRLLFAALHSAKSIKEMTMTATRQ